MTDWVDLWCSDDALNLRVQSTGDGARRRHRVVTGSPRPGLGGDGAVTVAWRDTPTGREVLLVRQHRVAVERDLWELPRGVADLEDADLVATGVRELGEEARVDARSARLAGVIHPDSGVLGTTVGVVVCAVVGEGTPDGVEVDEVRWVSVAALAAMIATGEVCDGITLAALAVAGVLSARP